MKVAQQVKETLAAVFDTSHISVEDESHQHAGHAGAPEGGQSHFALVLVTVDFEGKSRVQRHQAVYKALDSLLKGPIHALRMTLKTPAEWGAD